MKLILLSPPGGGKGTQAKRLKDHFDIPHISTGDILRNAIAEETPLGTKAKEYVESGGLVPDAVVVGLVEERLKEDDTANGYILDGFPRTVEQAKALDGFADIDVAVQLDVDDETVIERLTGRRSCRDCGEIYNLGFNPPEEHDVCDKCGGELYQRDDDKEATIRHRLETYKDQTEPLLEYYRDQSKLVTVDGKGDIDEIFDNLVTALDAL